MNIRESGIKDRVRVRHKRLFSSMKKEDFKRPKEYIYECWICQKLCNRKPALERHIETHFVRFHHCRWCAASFKTSHVLKVHTRICHSMVERDMALREELIKKAELDPDPRSRFFRIEEIKSNIPIPERATHVRYRSRKSMGLRAKKNAAIAEKEIKEMEEERQLQWEKEKQRQEEEKELEEIQKEWNAKEKQTVETIDLTIEEEKDTAPIKQETSDISLLTTQAETTLGRIFRIADNAITFKGYII